MSEMRARVTDNTYLDMRMDTVKYQREFKRQISISELIDAAWKVAKRHPDEISVILQEQTK